MTVVSVFWIAGRAAGSSVSVASMSGTASVLQQFVSGLKSRNEDTRAKAAKDLQHYVTTELREVKVFCFLLIIVMCCYSLVCSHFAGFVNTLWNRSASYHHNKDRFIMAWKEWSADVAFFDSWAKTKLQLSMMSWTTIYLSLCPALMWMRRKVEFLP